MVVLIEGFQNHLADFLRQGVPNFLPLEKKIDLPKKWQIWGYLLSTTLTWKISPKRSIYFVFAQIELKTDLKGPKIKYDGLKMNLKVPKKVADLKVIPCPCSLPFAEILFAK